MINLSEASGKPNSIEEDSGCTRPRELVHPAVLRNVAVAGEPHQLYTGEAPRRKVKTTATFPNDPRVIYKTLTFRIDRETSRRNIVDEDPLSGSVNGHTPP